MGERKAEDIIAGSVKPLEALRELITFPPKIWPRGLLIHGPNGTGKTSMVHAVVRESDAYLTVISPYTVYEAPVEESEKIIREAFDKAASHASSGKPSVVFIDEIDELCPVCESSKEQDLCISKQLCVLLDSINEPSVSGSHVVVVATANRIEFVGPALRRNGRFDIEIEVPPPLKEERYEILKLYTRRLQLDANTDLKEIAMSCSGFVGADLVALCREAAISAMFNYSVRDASVDPFIVKAEDWCVAKSIIPPSITKGVTSEIPKVTWEDMGGLQDLKRKLQRAVVRHAMHSDAISRHVASPQRGILLHGPPGCSKTTLVKAAAHAAQSTFFSLSGADVFSMYVGEGEALLRGVFRKARLAAPSIIFFDEIDTIATKRESGSGSKTSVGERLLSTLLNEMDGLEPAKGILVFAATNRPYAIDAALLRPGRFDLVLYTPPPDLDARHEILKVHTRKMSLAGDVDLFRVAKKTELFTGAELKGLCTEAGMVALRENIDAVAVYDSHFQRAASSLKPALTRERIASYESFRKVTSSPSRKRKWHLLDPGMFWGVALSLFLAASYLMLRNRFNAFLGTDVAT